MSSHPLLQRVAGDEIGARHRVFAVGLVWAAVGLMTVGGAASVSADSFVPPNSGPDVTLNTTSLSMEPDSGASQTVYEILSSVSDEGTMADLDSVGFCVFLVAPSSGDPVGDLSGCSSPDPATNVRIVWTRAGNSWSLEDGSANSYWALGTGGSAPSTDYVPTASTMALAARFTVGEAARAGSWGVRVSVSDGDATSAVTDLTGYAVTFYAAIAVQPAPQNFGTVAVGGYAESSLVAPMVLTNGVSSLSIALSGPFSNGEHAAELLGGAPATVPGANQVAYDCSPSASYSTASDVRVGTTPVLLNPSIYASGTTESGSGSVVQSCRLYNGGTLPRNGTAYSALAVMSVAPA